MTEMLGCLRHVDPEALAAQVRAVNAMLRADAGAIEVVEVTEEGAVHVRFAGMCGSCMSRPLTLEATVKPMLLQVPGVREVEMVGFRISEESQDGIRRAFRRAAEAAAIAAGSRAGLS